MQSERSTDSRTHRLDALPSPPFPSSFSSSAFIPSTLPFLNSCVLFYHQHPFYFRFVLTCSGLSYLCFPSVIYLIPPHPTLSNVIWNRLNYPRMHILIMIKHITFRWTSAARLSGTRVRQLTLLCYAVLCCTSYATLHLHIDSIFGHFKSVLNPFLLIILAIRGKQSSFLCRINSLFL